MREIRPSGLMRGGELTGELTTTVCLIFLDEFPAYSTHALGLPKFGVGSRRAEDRMNRIYRMGPDSVFGPAPHCDLTHVSVSVDCQA